MRNCECGYIGLNCGECEECRDDVWAHVDILERENARLRKQVEQLAELVPESYRWEYDANYDSWHGSEFQQRLTAILEEQTDEADKH